MRGRRFSNVGVNRRPGSTVTARDDRFELEASDHAPVRVAGPVPRVVYRFRSPRQETEGSLKRALAVLYERHPYHGSRRMQLALRNNAEIRSISRIYWDL